MERKNKIGPGNRPDRVSVSIISLSRWHSESDSSNSNLPVLDGGSSSVTVVSLRAHFVEVLNLKKENILLEICFVCQGSNICLTELVLH